MMLQKESSERLCLQRWIEWWMHAKVKKNQFVWPVEWSFVKVKMQMWRNRSQSTPSLFITAQTEHSCLRNLDKIEEVCARPTRQLEQFEVYRQCRCWWGQLLSRAVQQDHPLTTSKLCCFECNELLASRTCADWMPQVEEQGPFWECRKLWTGPKNSSANVFNWASLFCATVLQSMD